MTLPRRSPRRHRRSFAPRVLALEARALLATFLVTNDLDSGPGSLRQAVLDANALAGADRIEFAPALIGATIELSSGELSIADALAVDGPGTESLTIDANGTSAIFVAFRADATPTTPLLDVDIDGLTLTGGQPPEFSSGGAVLGFQVDMTITDCAVVENNDGAVGIFPGFFFDPETSQTTLVPSRVLIEDSTFEDNEGAVTIGGADATIRDSLFEGNTTDFGGGAVNYSLFGSGLAVSALIEDCTFRDNSADGPGFALGGAIANGGVMTVRDSLFEGNLARGGSGSSGGAIFNSFNTTLVVEDSEFRGNSAINIPGGFALASGGAIHSDTGTALTVTRSHFEDNLADSLFGAEGGAIRNDASRFFGPPSATTIIDSTFVGNRAIGRDAIDNFPPSAAFANGGAVHITGGPVTVSGGAFRRNLAQGGRAGATGFGGSGVGGGLSIRSGPVTITGTDFERNRAVGGTGGQFGGFAVGGGLVIDSFFFPAFDSTISSVRLIGNTVEAAAATEPGGTGGFAFGGGFSSFGEGTVTMTDVLAIANIVRGGAGGVGGAGGATSGGGINRSGGSLVLTRGTILGNIVRGGDAPGGQAGSAQGGGIFFAGGSGPGGLSIAHTTVSLNLVHGGAGASGGNGEGGGIWASRSFLADSSLITLNLAQGGAAGEGLGGGVFLAPGTTSSIRRTRIILNRASTRGNNLYQA